MFFCISHGQIKSSVELIPGLQSNLATISQSIWHTKVGDQADREEEEDLWKATSVLSKALQTVRL